MTSGAPGRWTVEWFGTTTFRVRRPGLDLFFDGYLDRLPGLAPVILRQDGIPADQILMVTGGETVACGPAASVRVLPALHSGLFAASDSDSGVECLGDLGVSAQDRRDRIAGIFAGGFGGAASPLAEAMGRMLEHSSGHDGGQLAFLLEQAETLRPGRVCFCHHDPLLPGSPGTDVTEAAVLIEDRQPGGYLALEYAAARPLFA